MARKPERVVWPICADCRQPHRPGIRCARRGRWLVRHGCTRCYARRRDGGYCGRHNGWPPERRDVP